MTLSPALLDFGQVSVGQSAEQVVVLGNTGASALTVNYAMDPQGAEFVFVANGGGPHGGTVVLLPGQPDSLRVSFGPEGEGHRTATVLFEDGQQVELGSVSLEGEGVSSPVVQRYYYVTDHLGSVRATVDEGGAVVHYDDYYPFGAQMPGRSLSTPEAPKERFTGYEYDDETESNGQTGHYYAGQRYYDPIIGRFPTVDRFLEKYPSLTPYQYAANNPIGFIDVNGDSAWAITGQWDEETIARYREYAAQQLGYYFDQGILCTCEDLALNVLIDFASANGLPVAITNGTGTLSASSDAFSNVADFRNAVLKTTGANDLVQFGNTVGVGGSPGDPSQLSAARAGDLILLSYRTETDYALTPGYPPVRLGQRSIYTHGQVVQSAEGGVVNIVQGNFRFSGFGQVAAGVRARLAGADWNDPRQQAYYIGARPTQASYTGGVYNRPGSDPNVFANQRGIVRAWNFAGMNGR